MPEPGRAAADHVERLDRAAQPRECELDAAVELDHGPPVARRCREPPEAEPQAGRSGQLEPFDLALEGAGGDHPQHLSIDAPRLEPCPQGVHGLLESIKGRMGGAGLPKAADDLRPCTAARQTSERCGDVVPFAAQHCSTCGSPLGYLSGLLRR